MLYISEYMIIALYLKNIKTKIVNYHTHTRNRKCEHENWARRELTKCKTSSPANIGELLAVWPGHGIGA